MRQILLMMVLVALVGCGKKEPAQPSASKPEPTKDKTTAGTKLWEFETGGDVGSSPAIGSDGTVYVGSVDGKLYAIDGKTGVKLWEFETVGDDKKLYAIDGKTGMWEFETPTPHRHRL